ncbi:MAG: PHP domain-containing protein [Methanomicrobiaceae archaeon]|nr:PHP domain-containing protein [Methanomicrobiaceae archaeon]
MICTLFSDAASPRDDETCTSGTIKFDMHVHSHYSSDAATDVRTIARGWTKYGILPLVCDHNTIRGAEKVYACIRETSPDVPAILAEEIMTTEGEIIGLFLNEEIPAFLSAHETLDRIEEQGALSIVPHPFCTFRPSAIITKTLYEVIDRIDIVEGYNARTLSQEENRRGRDFARAHGKPLSVGSDAHTPFELCRNYLEMDPFDDPAGLLRTIREGKVTFQSVNASEHAVHILTRIIRIAKAGGLLQGA